MLNLNIDSRNQKAFANLTDREQREIIARQQSNKIPMSQYINSGSQPRGTDIDPRELIDRSKDFRAAQDQVGNAQVINPMMEQPIQSLYTQSGISDYVDTTTAEEGGLGPGLSPATIYAMERQGLIPKQGGIQYQEDGVLQAPTGLVSDFVNRSPRELIDKGFIPTGLGGVQSKNLGKDGNTRGTYSPMSEDEVVSQVGKLQSDSKKLGSVLANAAAGEDPTLFQALHDEFGKNAFAIDEETGTNSINPEVAMNLLLAYYTAMEESSYAEYSDKERINHARYKGEYHENHPDLWKPKQGKSARTPELNVLESGIGAAFESNGNVKFGKKYNGDIIGQSVLRAIQVFDKTGMSDITKTYMGATQEGYYPEGDMEPVYGMKQDKSIKRDKLALTKGIRDLLNPGKRNNVRVTKRINPRNVNSEIVGPRQSGVDPIRTQAQNILEDIPMRIDQGLLRILNRTYFATDELNAFWNGGSMKVKETSFNIVNQQDAYINQAGSDGVYYTDQHYRSSGRKGDDNLLMADFKIVRALSIAAHSRENIAFGTESERAFKVGVMFLLGEDTNLENSNIKLFNTMFGDANSPGRKFASALDLLSRQDLNEEGIAAIVQANFSGENLKNFNRTFMSEGSDGVQALRAVADYYKSKDRGASSFPTSLIGEVDASQSGQTIQSFQIGNFLGAMRGGLMDKNSFQKRLDNDVINSVPKLYEETRSLAQSKIEGKIPEGSNLRLIASSFFGDSNGNYEDNLFQNRFAKTGVQGASYGQMFEGSVAAILEEMYAWFGEGSVDEQLSRINRLNNLLGSEMNMDSIIDNAEVAKALSGFATDFVTSMYDADPLLLEYSLKMRDAFKVMTKMKQFGYKMGKKWGEPMMVYRTPSDPNNVYGSKWIDGMRTTMIDKTIPEEYLTASFEADANLSDDYFRSVAPIQYQTGSPELDYDSEIAKQTFQKGQRSFLNDTQSGAITRFPVISIHGLDDLIMSITVSELNKELKRDGGDGLKYIMSVWDAGRVPVTIRDKFSKHYDKAFLKVMEENSFFKMMSRGMAEYIREGRKDRAAIEQAGLTPLFEELESAVGGLVSLSHKYEGLDYNSKNELTPTGGGRASFFGNTIAFNHAASGMNQPVDKAFRNNPKAIENHKGKKTSNALLQRILEARKAGKNH